LRRFYATRDFSHVDPKCVVADILSHSSHNYDILDLHLARLV
jgi:hypothetical protein